MPLAKDGWGVPTANRAEPKPSGVFNPALIQESNSHSAFQIIPALLTLPGGIPRHRTKPSSKTYISHESFLQGTSWSSHQMSAPRDSSLGAEAALQCLYHSGSWHLAQSWYSEIISRSGKGGISKATSVSATRGWDPRPRPMPTGQSF